MANKVLSTQELADFFGISRQALKKVIDNGNLAGRLLELNYRLTKNEKLGRKVLFYLEEVVVLPKETWKELVAKEFPKIRKVEQLGIHTKERLVNGTILTKEMVARTGVARQTSERWDELLVEKGLMTNNGYSYYLIYHQKELQQITYGEYLSYWREFNISRLEPNELASLVETENGHVAEQLHVVMNGMCVKVKSYLVNEFTEKYERVVAALDVK